jgi:hypothetical protein
MTGFVTFGDVRQRNRTLCRTTPAPPGKVRFGNIRPFTSNPTSASASGAMSSASRWQDEKTKAGWKMMNEETKSERRLEVSSFFILPSSFQMGIDPDGKT